MKSENVDGRVVEDFGAEWARFDQGRLEGAEYDALFHSYFEHFPWEMLPRDSVGFDLGCGSGRWARGVAPRVGTLHCVDPAAPALAVARRNLAQCRNVVLHQATVDAIPLPDASCDFGYSLGVLHHIPDTGAALRSCVAKLKPGAPFLLYLYYRFDNRPAWFRMVWRTSDLARRVISHLPRPAKTLVSDVIAALVYWPLARSAALAERAGMKVDRIPLSFYRGRTFYTMRTDALDRFGTRLEQRFTRQEMREMMEAAGLVDIRFREGAPFWVAVGRRG